MHASRHHTIAGRSRLLDKEKAQQEGIFNKAEQFVTRNWIRNSPGNETRNEIIYETVPFLCLAQFVVLGISDTKLGYETGNFAAPNVAMTSVSVSDDAGGDDCRLTPFMQVYPPHGGNNLALAALEPLEEAEWYRQMASLRLAIAWCKVVASKGKKAKVLEEELRRMFEFSVNQIPPEQWPHGAKAAETIERLLAVFKRKSKGGTSYIELVDKAKREREFIRDVMNPWLTKNFPDLVSSDTKLV